MKRAATYKVGDLARISGVSVRTLHHYDEIGLLTPANRTGSGYRVYDADSVLRLQQILINRALGLSLEDIRRTLDDPQFDLETSLNAQLAQLELQMADTQAMVKSVRAALANLQNSKKGKAVNFKEIFGGFDPSRHEAEVKERWGKTDAYKETSKRTARYTEDHWRVMAIEQDAVFHSAADVFARGLAVDDLQVVAVLERHRRFIGRWFYPCTVEFQAKLADMWDADVRFADTIDGYGEGLTAFLIEAIRLRASA